MNDHEKAALKILKRLTRQQRKNLDDAGHPEGIPRIKEEDWRVQFYATLSKEASPDTRRVTFDRTRRTLAERGKINVENSFVFLQN